MPCCSPPLATPPPARDEWVRFIPSAFWNRGQSRCPDGLMLWPCGKPLAHGRGSHRSRERGRAVSRRRQTLLTKALVHVGVDDVADFAEDVAHHAAESRHGGYRRYRYHAGGQGVFHKVLPFGVFPDLKFQYAISKPVHRFYPFLKHRPRGRCRLFSRLPVKSLRSATSSRSW